LGFTVTSVNGASIVTGQSPPFGVACGQFVAASSQYLSIPQSSVFSFTGPLTIEARVKFNSLPTGVNVSAVFVGGGFSDNWDLYYNSDGYLGFCYNGQWPSNYSWHPSTGVWYDVEVDRDNSNNVYAFVNGTLLGTNTFSGTINASENLYVGNDPDYPTCLLDGWQKEIRVSNGVARHTSNFTPSTQPYSPDPYTVLLLHMEGPNGSTTFMDDSTDTTVPTTTTQMNPIYQFMFRPRKIDLPFAPRLVA
jgi:hypothetical protein